MRIKSGRPILIIEDSPEDFEAARRAFHKANVANPIFRCADGDEALDYLYRKGPYRDPAKSPRPGIILLDLNLPGTDGRELLAEIKQDIQFKKTPVIILTTSSHSDDIELCYAAGANSFICKPMGVSAYSEMIRTLTRYWFGIAALPRREN